jgi:Uma2 family endonuclease
MTVEEFLDWPGDGSGLRFQLINGVPRPMAPASTDHGIIQLNIGRAIGNHLDALDSDYVAGTELPVQTRLMRRRNARAPDVTVTSAPSSKSRVVEEPLVIVEVMSPSNEDETWEKILALALVPSLREIVVVDSTVVGATVYRRSDDGTWPVYGETVAAGGTIRLATLALDIPMAAVYRRTLLAADAVGPAPST